MNETDIKSIEKQYSVTLPHGYREMLKSTPKIFDALLKCDEEDNPGQTPFFTDAGMIIAMNQIMRDPDDPEFFEFDPNDSSKPWPRKYLIIGSDVGGNFYCIAPATNKSRVYFWYQGDTAFSKFADDMAGFVKKIFKLYGEIDAMDCQSDSVD